MIIITNEKVAGFEPRWAPFAGFSLLFDNPPPSLTPMADGLLKLDCRLEETGDEDGLVLYRGLAAALRKIGLDLLVNSYLFCPLPPYSYHVTVWDGLNVRNARRVSPEHRYALEAFLEELPDSFLEDRRFTVAVDASPLASRPDWSINFHFERLAKWDNDGLTALVVPADFDSEEALAQIVDARRALSEEFERKYGLAHVTPYAPHVSLGYFANKEQAELATSQMDRWSDLVNQEVAGLTITYRTIHLYGFSDMVTFYRAP